MRKFVLLLGFTIIAVYLNGQDVLPRKVLNDHKESQSQDGKLELAKAGDFILDINDFEYAKLALEYYNLPVDYEMDKEVTELGVMFGKNFLEKHARHATLKMQHTNNQAESFFIGSMDANPSKSSDKTIKCFHFSIGEYHQDKFISDLTSLGYKKVKTEDVKLVFYGIRPQTTYQKGNKECKVVHDGTHLQVDFARSKEEMNEEEESISKECKFFLSLEVEHESPIINDGDNYQAAKVVIDFPDGNTLINLPYDVLEGRDLEPERMNRSGSYMGKELRGNTEPGNLRRTPVHVIKQFIADSSGELEWELSGLDLKSLPKVNNNATKRLEAMYKMENSLAEWIAQYIKVPQPAIKYFPRFNKKFRVNSSFVIEIEESKDDYDSCKLHLDVKRKRVGSSNYDYTINNTEEVMAVLSKVYKNEVVSPSLVQSLKRKMDNNDVLGDKFEIDVYAYRHTVKYIYKGRSAVYKLPVVFEWGKPQ